MGQGEEEEMGVGQSVGEEWEVVEGKK